MVVDLFDAALDVEAPEVVAAGHAEGSRRAPCCAASLLLAECRLQYWRCGGRGGGSCIGWKWALTLVRHTL